MFMVNIFENLNNSNIILLYLRSIAIYYVPWYILFSVYKSLPASKGIGIGLFWPWWWTIFPPLSEHVQKSCSFDLFLLVKCLMAPTVLIQKWFLPIQCEECCKQNYLERFRLIIGLVIWIKSWNVTCYAVTKVTILCIVAYELAPSRWPYFIGDMHGIRLPRLLQTLISFFIVGEWGIMLVAANYVLSTISAVILVFVLHHHNCISTVSPCELFKAVCTWIQESSRLNLLYLAVTCLQYVLHIKMLTSVPA